MNILIAENLKKYYQMGENVVKALDGVSLSVRQGEFLAIVGQVRKRQIHAASYAGRIGSADLWESHDRTERYIFHG